MELGLFMMPQHPPTRTLYDSWQRDFDLLCLADQLGYHEAWIGEHITETWENAPVPELLIAQALKMTQHLVLGTGVKAVSASRWCWVCGPPRTANSTTTANTTRCMRQRCTAIWDVGSGFNLTKN